mmetsp:Transcript_34451/g.77687  ORF Transcript_34451/g.77687 Transcript_34451/m.77687 type:complete len:263 (+) Transcript_34451:505-1293(+)
MHRRDRNLGHPGLFDVVTGKLMGHLVGGRGADGGGRNGKNVAHMHHGGDDLPRCLVGLVHRPHPLKLEVPPNVDDGDPVVGGVEEDRVALNQDLDVFHQVRHHRRQRLHQHAVARSDNFLLPIAAVDGEAAPVRAPENLLMVGGSLLQVADDGRELAQGDLRVGVRGEDTPDRLAALHRHQPLEALGRDEVLLLPLHHLLEDGLSVSILLEVLPDGVKQLVDRCDQAVLELGFAELSRDEVVLHALEGGVARPSGCKSCLRH